LFPWKVESGVGVNFFCLFFFLFFFFFSFFFFCLFFFLFGNAWARKSIFRCMLVHVSMRSTRSGNKTETGKNYAKETLLLKLWQKDLF
jgi:hypothetical protein